MPLLRVAKEVLAGSLIRDFLSPCTEVSLEKGRQDCHNPTNTMSRRKKTNLFGHKAENSRVWKRFLLWGGALSGCLVLFGVVAWYQVLAYVQSEDFRRLAENRLSEHFHARSVVLSGSLHLDGDRVSEDGIAVENLGSLRSGKAGRISMELDRMALLSRRLSIRKLSVEEAELLFEQKEAPKEAKKQKKADAVSHTGSSAVDRTASASPTPTSQGFFSLLGWDMELMECKDTELTYRRKGEDYSLQGCSVTSVPLKSGCWQHTAENGRLHTPYALLRGASVRTATIRQDSDGLSLTDCRIMLYPGEMRIRAHLDAGSQKWSANIALNKSGVAPLLRGDWKKRVSGELYGKATLTGEQSGMTGGEGSISLQDGVLEGLPFLSELPGEGGYPYRHLPLDKAECRLSFPYAAPEHHITEAWLFDNINICAKNGLLRVHGHVIVGADGALGGTLTIGLPKKTVSALPMAGMLQGLFNAQGEEGYLWMNVNLSGTLDEPEEDLSVRCAALMKNALPSVTGQAATTTEQMFRMLLTPQKPARQPGEEPGIEPAPASADAIHAATEGIQQGIQGALKLLF